MAQPSFTSNASRSPRNNVRSDRSLSSGDMTTRPSSLSYFPAPHLSSSMNAVHFGGDRAAIGQPPLLDRQLSCPSKFSKYIDVGSPYIPGRRRSMSETVLVERSYRSYNSEDMPAAKNDCPSPFENPSTPTASFYASADSGSLSNGYKVPSNSLLPIAEKIEAQTKAPSNSSSPLFSRVRSMSGSSQERIASFTPPLAPSSSVASPSPLDDADQQNMCSSMSSSTHSEDSSATHSSEIDGLLFEMDI